MTTTPIAPSLPPPTVPAEPSRLWRPTADPHKVVPVADVDLTRRPPGYPLGIAIGAALSTLGGLAWALWARQAGDTAGLDMALALGFVAFLTSMLASHIHRIRIR